MKHDIWCSLTLFEGSDVGGTTLPELTLQATNGTGAEEMASAAGEQETKQEREQAFRRLMEGEYKDLFTAYFQETFNRRFKEQKSMKEELLRARAVLDAARECYGVADEEGLCAAIRAKKESVASAETAPSPTASSPEASSVSSPQAGNGEGEETIAAAVKVAVERAKRETECAVLESIRARGLRPSEGALIPGIGAPVGGAASRLTRAQRAEMAQRAARGEHIEF